MSLDETISGGQAAHVADHDALRVEAAGRGVTVDALIAGVSINAAHENVHRTLHTNHNLIGAATTLPTTGLANGHLAHHEALHKAYNLRISGPLAGSASRTASVAVTASGMLPLSSGTAARAASVGITASGALAGGSVLFFEDFSTGNFNKWGQLQWQTSGVVRNSDGNLYDGTSEYSGAVANGGTGHTQAARFELRDGDNPFGTGTERTEMSTPGPDDPALEPVQGDLWRVEWDMKFESSFPTPVATSGFCVIHQWHGSGPTSSPPLCLDVDSDDIIYLANNDATGYQRTAVQSVTRNVWQHWKYDVFFHPNAATGWVTLTVDGVVEINHQARATMIPAESSNYFKAGIYRDSDNSATAILWFDNITFTDLAAGLGGSATRSEGATITASGAAVGTAPRSLTSLLTAAAAAAGSASRASAVAVTASSGAPAGTASQPATVTITGSGAAVGSATRTASVGITASGSLVGGPALAVTLKSSGVVDQATSATGNFPSEVLGAITFAAGSVVLVILGGARGNSASALTDLRATASGLTFTQEAGAIQAGAADTAWLRALTAPHTSGGSTSITIDTNNFGAYQLFYAVYEITGHNVADPVGAVAQAAQSTTLNGTYSITLGAAPATNSIVIAGFAADADAGTSSVDVGAGWTEDAEVDSTASFYGVFQTQRRTGSTSTSVAWADIQGGASPALYSTAAVAVEIKAS